MAASEAKATLYHRAILTVSDRSPRPARRVAGLCVVRDVAPGWGESSGLDG
jgi:hypothetical protein